MLLSRSPEDTWRGHVVRTRILQMQNEIVDIHRDAMDAPDGEEQLQIWMNGLAATRESLVPN